MKKKVFIWIFCAAAFAALLWFKARTASDPSWAQPTMGTVCHITVPGSIPKGDLTALREEIDAALEDVNRRMSTWQADTEISQFNRFQSMEPFPVSLEFGAVLKRALEISEATDGAFDPTVKPLVDYWGFGLGSDHIALDEILKSVGWGKVKLENGALIKLHPQVQLDLAAIAKGYGVDAVADVIRSAGFEHFLVEIGGEVVAEGENPEGRLWGIGIEVPLFDQSFGEAIFQTLELSGRALATSGDYRNFRVREDGTRYSHIVDPHTGNPAETDVAAVSVLSDSCMTADAVATALFVMGSEKGIPWVEARSDLAAFFILHAPNQTFISRATSGFPVER